MKAQVKIFDTTLWDGEQSRGAAMNVAEKARIAQQLEKLDVDAVEAGFPSSSEYDFTAMRFVKLPMIHKLIATPDVHLKYKLRNARERVLNEAVKAVRRAKSLCDHVEFSTEDAARSNTGGR